MIVFETQHDSLLLWASGWELKIELFEHCKNCLLLLMVDELIAIASALLGPWIEM